jgi:microcystin-dependent protein
MTQPFLSEIRIMSFDFAPKGWALCNGQLLPASQNSALFSVIGTTYGGNAVNFALPNLQGRAPISMGSGYVLGQNAGEQAHTLNTTEMPSHTHQAYATTVAGSTGSPTGNLLGATDGLYGALPSNPTTLQPATVTSTGGNEPHNNMQPYLVLNFCIALQGIFPTPN